MRFFGEVGIVKVGDKIKGKLTNRGKEMVFLGFEDNHPSQK